MELRTGLGLQSRGRFSSAVLVITFRQSGNHQGDGPKLPHQAVVIRQSAMHRKGRDAIDLPGGVEPHTSLGRVPVSVCFFCSDLQTSQNRRQHLADGLDATTTCVLLQDLCDNLGFMVARIVSAWSVAGPFGCPCPNILHHAPFPPPAHQTGRVDFPHPAFGQGLTRSLTRKYA